MVDTQDLKNKSQCYGKACKNWVAALAATNAVSASVTVKCIAWIG